MKKKLFYCQLEKIKAANYKKINCNNNNNNNIIRKFDWELNIHIKINLRKINKAIHKKIYRLFFYCCCYAYC